MSGRIFKKLREMPIWQLLLVCVTTSELLTLLLSYSVSRVLWGKMSDQVLIIGIIDSLLVSFVIVGLLLLFIHKIRELYVKLEDQNKKLSSAILEINTLREILPICSYCKQIRNDEGYYEQIESYFHKHSGVDFSHTICPECGDRLYGEEDWYIEMKKKSDRST